MSTKAEGERERSKRRKKNWRSAIEEPRMEEGKDQMNGWGKERTSKWVRRASAAGLEGEGRDRKMHKWKDEEPWGELDTLRCSKYYKAGCLCNYSNNFHGLAFTGFLKKVVG